MPTLECREKGTGRERLIRPSCSVNSRPTLVVHYDKGYGAVDANRFLKCLPGNFCTVRATALIYAFQAPILCCDFPNRSMPRFTTSPGLR